MSKPQAVLIVEDEAIIAIDLANHLDDMGFKPLVASTVIDALLIVQSQQVDFAILDYRVGGATTGEVAEVLREKQVPFALCSGSDLGLAAHIFEGVPFIPKPYTEDHLKAAIHSVIN